MSNIGSACDAVLQQTISATPGVVAMVTVRNGNIDEGAAGQRALGQDQPMTADSVSAILSTTKAITVTAALQRAEERLLGLDAPAENGPASVDGYRKFEAAAYDSLVLAKAA